jgi:hypothetical protein
MRYVQRSPRREVPDGLSPRARDLVLTEGAWAPVPALDHYYDKLVRDGVPTDVVQRARDHHARWAGLSLPRSAEYDGGPCPFHLDAPQYLPGAGWWFEVGAQRSALPYSFAIGPDHAYGLVFSTWVPTHRSVEAWIESLAIERLAQRHATSITQLSGDTVEDIDLTDATQVPEAGGICDTWWRQGRTLIAIHRGESLLLGRPADRRARIYNLPGSPTDLLKDHEVSLEY